MLLLMYHSAEKLGPFFLSFEGSTFIRRYLVSLLIHSRSEKFYVVDAAWTCDLVIVTELWEGSLEKTLFPESVWSVDEL